MRYTRLLLLLSFNSLLFSAPERITSFISDITVNSDATLTVQESIEVMCEQESIRHGIVREFPTSYRDAYGTYYNVDFKIQSITHNGYDASYQVESVSNGKKIYIGDKNILLAEGLHLYSITYTTNRQLGFFHGHDEIYWNVTGNGWRLPIDKVQAQVHLPKGISPQSIKAQAYTGYQGERGKNYSYDIKDNCVTFSTNHRLQQFQGLTIVATFPKGFVVKPSWYQKIYWFFRDNLLLLGICIGLFLLLLLLILGAITVRRINKPGIVIPLFHPPAGMMPSDVGFMTKMQFDNKLLSADIIDLAVHNFITITYNAPKIFGRGTYTLTIKDSINPLIANTKMNPHHEKLLRSLFGKKDKILIVSKKHNGKIEAALEECKKHTNEHNALYITKLLSRARISMSIAFFLLIACGFILNDPMKMTGFIIPIMILIFIFIFLIPKLFRVYTPAGRKLQDAIDGFKLYLMTAEIERMNIIGTPPTKTPELYEKYLPYAMALGIEKQWTAQFSALFKDIEEETGHTYYPLWYHGKNFRADSFGSNFTGSFTDTIASSSTAPGSSSGSDGGGSSGGGGGGGGGGGW